MRRHPYLCVLLGVLLAIGASVLFSQSTVIGQYGGGGLILAANSSHTTVGAFASTLTFTATTNSTFPAGTHNLAPLDSPVFTNLPNIGAAVAASLQPLSDSTTALRIFKADGSTVVLVIDTTNGNLGIGTTPNSAAKLDVVGSARIHGGNLLLDTIQGYSTAIVSMQATTDLAIPHQQATTGQRYACFTTTGQLVSSATACSGT
jgi:hypothetical protein